MKFEELTDLVLSQNLYIIRNYGGAFKFEIECIHSISDLTRALNIQFQHIYPNVYYGVKNTRDKLLITYLISIKPLELLDFFIKSKESYISEYGTFESFFNQHKKFGRIDKEWLPVFEQKIQEFKKKSIQNIGYTDIENTDIL